MRTIGRFDADSAVDKLAAADVDANAEDAIFALGLISSTNALQLLFIVGQRVKREKRDLARMSPPQTKHKQRRQRKTNLGQIYISSKYLVRPHFCHPLCIVCVCAFSALLERERELEKERNDVSFSLSFFSRETPPWVRRLRCARWGTTTVPKTPTSSSRRKKPTKTDSDL